jgi:D-3-phosphoglycerate dehydrogenase / 2-oxoglutarate reductase
MDGPRFRIGYLKRPMHAAFLETAARDPKLDVTRITLDEGEAAAESALAACHGYYTTSARDELPPRFRVTADFLGRNPNLLLVATYGAGYDTIDVDACTAAGVAVVNQAGGNAEGVAEHAVGMMLALLKRIPEAHAAMRAGAVKDRAALLGRELAGRTVGIVGLGHTGTRTAEILKVFGCRVLATDPYLDAATCAARGAEKVELPQLLAEGEIVSVHCPLTGETRGMFNAAAYAAMRTGALFISTARGSIHDEEALHAALASGRLAGAGLDVWEREPPPATHALLAHPCVIASPHIAGATHESRARVARMAAEAFAEAAGGRPPPRLLNLSVAARFVKRWETLFGGLRTRG